MKINHTIKIGSVVLATLPVIFVNSCASHETGVVTPINLPKIQGVAAAPASLNGKTLILTSLSQKITRISFKTFGPTLVMARVTICPNNGGEVGWYFLEMRFNDTNTGTYRLEEEIGTERTVPNRLVEEGSFVIQ